MQKAKEDLLYLLWKHHKDAFFTTCALIEGTLEQKIEKAVQIWHEQGWRTKKLYGKIGKRILYRDEKEIYPPMSIVSSR